MATIINNPPSNNEGNPLGMIIGLVVLAVIVYLGFVYGIPAIRQMSVNTTPQINVPSEIDVNINQNP